MVTVGKRTFVGSRHDLLIGALLAAVCFCSATTMGQAVGPTPGAGVAARAVTITPNVSLGPANPFTGSVPAGQPTPGVLALTIREALERGLKYNLGLILSQQATETARGARWRSLSDVLPHVNAHTAEVIQQTNLAALGLPAGLLPPGVSPIVGPFSVFDARATVRSPIVDLHFLNTFHASTENLRASQYTYQDSRDLVVLVVGGTYMQTLAGAALIDAVQAQVTTAQRLFEKAQDQKNAGVAAGIDVLRAQVEFQAQQQRLLVAKNEFEKQKLALARAIGLPLAQQFRLAETIPYSPAPPMTLEQALERAYQHRADYLGAQALVRAAELSRKAAVAERYPNVTVAGDYGTLGRAPGNSHGTFTATASLNVPIFQGGKVRGDITQADAVLAQRRAQLDDQRSRIEFEVRSAFLDLQSAADQVQVARSSVDVAQQTLTQAQDRFSAGVTSNIEVVQAQEALAAANENYIASLLAHNLAKLALARALGVAEEASKEFLGGNP
jgi:outer membrane protein TolC